MDNRDAPATKGGIIDLKGDIVDLKGDIVDLNEKIEQLRSEADHRYNDIVERIADGKTRLLKAFPSFAETNQTRMAAIDANDAAIRNRLGTLETRLLEVEKRLNMPPQAA